MEKYLKPTNIKDELPDKDGYYFIDNLNQLAICNLYFYTLTSRWYYDSSLYDEANEENFLIWYKPVLVEESKEKLIQAKELLKELNNSKFSAEERRKMDSRIKKFFTEENMQPIVDDFLKEYKKSLETKLKL